MSSNKFCAGVIMDNNVYCCWNILCNAHIMILRKVTANVNLVSNKSSLQNQHMSHDYCVALAGILKVRSHTRGRTRAEAGGKLASTQIITCVHTCAAAEPKRSGSKIHSARNGSNTQFAASETARSKPSLSSRNGRSAGVRSASAPRMCEHTRGSAGGMSKTALLRSATAPRMCERSFIARASQLRLQCDGRHVNDTYKVLLMPNSN